MKKVILSLLLFAVFSSVSSQTRKFGKIEKAELEENMYSKDSLCNAVYLYKKRTSSFKFNQQSFSFELETKIHEIIKIYNSDGFKHATHTINYYDPEKGSEKEKVVKIKAYAYNLENGKIHKEKLSSKNIFQNQKNKYWATKTFTMPTIKAGTIIEYSYSISSPYWDIRDLQFQYGIPIKKLIYTTEIPEYFRFNKQVKGYYFINPTIKTLNKSISWTTKSRSGGGRNTVQTSYENEKMDHLSELATYKAQDIPALKNNEPFVSNIDNYRGGMKYELSATKFPNSVLKSYSTTWESVSQTVFDSENFGQELNYSNYFKDDLEVLLKDKTTSTEKTSAIFEFVKSKVKWNRYSSKYTNKGVRKAYKEGSGNIAEINLMLVAMLREAGLIANPVLISTRDNGVPIFPTREGFNYVIAAVHSDTSGYILLDASEQYSSPNNLPLRDLNWNGRMIADNGRSTAIPLSPKTYSESNNSLTIKIDSNYAMHGFLSRKLNGLQAFDYRTKNNRIKEEDLIQKLENKYHVEISNFRYRNKENPTKKVAQFIQFESADLIEVINGKMYIDPLLFFTTKVNPFKSEQRKFPVDFGTPWVEKNQISINIPEGYKIESMPTTFGIGLPDNIGIYKFLINANSSVINIRSEEKFNAAIISPKYYNELKTFYSELVSKQKEKIILSKI